MNGPLTPADDVRALLADVAAGRTSIDEAAAALAALGIAAIGDFACLDVGRAARKGVPEIVFGEGKTVEQFVAIVAALLCRRAGGRWPARRRPSRPRPWPRRPAARASWHERARVLVVRRADWRAAEPRGVVGVLAGGTSDVGVADEAVIVCREMGVEVLTAYDVGRGRRAPPGAAAARR